MFVVEWKDQKFEYELGRDAYQKYRELVMSPFKLPVKIIENGITIISYNPGAEE